MDDRREWRNSKKSDQGAAMRLRFLGSNGEQGTCPAVYETDRDTIAVQGKLITDPEALGDAVNLAPDEIIIEIPKDLLPHFPQG
jgi:hypothetical protein